MSVNSNFSFLEFSFYIPRQHKHKLSVFYIFRYQVAKNTITRTAIDNSFLIALCLSASNMEELVTSCGVREN